MDKKLYVIGGWNGQRGITRCDIFDTEMGEWSNMAPLSTGIFAVSLYIYICTYFQPVQYLKNAEHSIY